MNENEVLPWRRALPVFRSAARPRRAAWSWRAAWSRRAAWLCSTLPELLAAGLRGIGP